jgi:hypothetical protein
VQALGDQVAETLRTKVGGQIEIINVIVPLVNYDQDTQDRINALNVEKASTRVAEQRAKTAKAEARGDEILSASVSNDPECSGQASVWTPRHRARRTSARWAAGRTPLWCPPCLRGSWFGDSAMRRAIFAARFSCVASDPVRWQCSDGVDRRPGHRAGVEHLVGRACSGDDALGDDGRIHTAADTA